MTLPPFAGRNKPNKLFHFSRDRQPEDSPPQHEVLDGASPSSHGHETESKCCDGDTPTNAWAPQIPLGLLLKASRPRGHSFHQELQPLAADTTAHIPPGS